MEKASYIFQTPRLQIRRATDSEADADFFYGIWTNSQVMALVGFPYGLRITRNEIREMFERESDSEYNQWLIVEFRQTYVPIGECKLGWPNEDGISETDVKLLPDYWGLGFGTEIKRGLVNYLFTHTDCRAVKATPNKKNLASQKMQEAVGGKRVGEDLFQFPREMKDYTCDVPHYVYMVLREDWEKMRNQK